MSKVKVKFLRDHKGHKKGAEVSVTPRAAIHLKNQGAAADVKPASTATKGA